MIELFSILLRNIGIISVMIVLLARLSIFQNTFDITKIKLSHKLFYIFFFGAIGIYGTFAGAIVDGAYANSRIIGPFLGGLVGGPVVGLFSGLIAGVHRYAANPDGFTSLACVVITPLQGLTIGLLRPMFFQMKNRWLMTLLLGAAAETLHMGTVILLSRPLDHAIELVKIIGIPMIIANSIGVSIFVLILESMFKSREELAAHHAKRVIEIATRTLVYLRNGLTSDSTKKAAQIILDLCHLDAVSFTDTVNVLAHVGDGAEFHPEGQPVKTDITKGVLATGLYKVGEHIHSEPSECPLKSSVVVPIVLNGKVAGTFKMYKKEENSINALDVQLALGLTTLFNQQLELALVSEQQALLKEAEYHALQAQINPHFLFNALNTVSSVVRTSPEKGRELLLSLSEFLRGNLNHTQDIQIMREIEHVQAYVDIEKARFGDQLEVTMDIEIEGTFALPPLTLQPLVENAIKHGVRAKKQKGEVNLRVCECEKNYIIEIKDNGIGMSEEKLKTLLMPEVRVESLGLINIHQRLLSRYQDGRGLEITSVPEKGTCVAFRVPKEDKL